MNNLETYDQLITIDVDVQNDFCPGGRLAVADGDQVVTPLNAINQWTRDKDGYVIFTRDWHPRETSHFDKWPKHCVQFTGGAAFHDDLLIEYPDEIASKGQRKDQDGYSGWEANVRGRLYEQGDGRVPDINTVNKAIEKMVDVYNHRKRQRVAIVVGGLATDYCVRATVLDALAASKKMELQMLGLFANNPPEDEELPLGRRRRPTYPEPLIRPLGVFVLKDAVRAVDLEPGDGDRALAEMEAAGAIVTTTEAVMNGEVFQLGEK